MRLLPVVAAFSFLSTAAVALSNDDYFTLPGSEYSACVLGHAAIVMYNLERIEDPFKIVEMVRAKCPSPGLDEATMGDLNDYIDEIAEDLAVALNMREANK